MKYRYVLKDREPVPTEDFTEWCGAMCHVADDTIDGVRVSTVFLGLDSSFGQVQPPLLFETMIFGGEHDGYQERTPTWKDAENAHKRALARIQMRLVKSIEGVEK